MDAMQGAGGALDGGFGDYEARGGLVIPCYGEGDDRGVGDVLKIRVRGLVTQLSYGEGRFDPSSRGFFVPGSSLQPLMAGVYVLHSSFKSLPRMQRLSNVMLTPSGFEGYDDIGNSGLTRSVQELFSSVDCSFEEASRNLGGAVRENEERVGGEAKVLLPVGVVQGKRRLLQSALYESGDSTSTEEEEVEEMGGFFGGGEGLDLEFAAEEMLVAASPSFFGGAMRSGGLGGGRGIAGSTLVGAEGPFGAVRASAYDRSAADERMLISLERRLFPGAVADVSEPEVSSTGGRQLFLGSEVDVLEPVASSSGGCMSESGLLRMLTERSGEERVVGSSLGSEDMRVLVEETMEESVEESVEGSVGGGKGEVVSGSGEVRGLKCCVDRVGQEKMENAYVVLGKELRSVGEVPTRLLHKRLLVGRRTDQCVYLLDGFDLLTSLGEEGPVQTGKEVMC